VKEYLEKTNPHLINYNSWHKFSGLYNLEASSEWMKNWDLIVKHKKGEKSIKTAKADK